MATRGRGTPRECPVDGTTAQCGANVRPGKIMCPAHWARVPKATQRDVLRTWKLFQATDSMEAWDAYALARRAALDAAGAPL